MLRGYAQEVESRDGRHLRDTPSYFSGHMGAGLGPRHYTVHLRAVLILQFIEHLDKLMYNAYEGSCVTLPPVPKVCRFTCTYMCSVHCTLFPCVWIEFFNAKHFYMFMCTTYNVLFGTLISRQYTL